MAASGVRARLGRAFLLQAAFIGAAAVVYPAGWLIYRFIENPGISLGRRVVGRLGSRSPSRSPT